MKNFVQAIELLLATAINFMKDLRNDDDGNIQSLTHTSCPKNVGRKVSAEDNRENYEVGCWCRDVRSVPSKKLTFIKLVIHFSCKKYLVTGNVSKDEGVSE